MKTYEFLIQAFSIQKWWILFYFLLELVNFIAFTFSVDGFLVMYSLF